MCSSAPIRQHILEQIAAPILRIPDKSTVRVAMNGEDGSSKRCFGNELAYVLAQTGFRFRPASV